MKQLWIRVAFAATFLWTTPTQLLAGYDEEIAAAQAYEATPHYFSKQINRLCNLLASDEAQANQELQFALQFAKEGIEIDVQDGNNVYHQVVKNALEYIQDNQENIEKDISNNVTYNELRTSLQGAMMLRTAQVISYLLSPTCFKPGYAKHGDDLCTKLKIRILNEAGSLDGGRSTLDKWSLLTEHFKPIILVGKDALFSQEGYLELFGQGYMLFGLPLEKHSVHGGLYEEPGELLYHDRAHPSSIVSLDNFPNEQKQFVQNLQKLAQEVYASVKEIEDPDAKKRYTLATFYWFHETPLRFLQKGFLDAYQESKVEALTYLNEKFLAHLAKDLTPKEGLSSGNREYYLRQGYDFGQAIINIYPEATSEIFPKMPSNWSNYSGKAALKWNTKLMDDFYSTIVDILRERL